MPQPSQERRNMGDSKKQRQQSKKLKFAPEAILFGLFFVWLTVCVHFYRNHDGLAMAISSDIKVTPSALRSSNVDFHIEETCTILPTIRASGPYFLDNKIQAGVSPDSVSPAFKVGSYYAEKVMFHMRTDQANFWLVKDLLKGQEGGLVFDIGANQGFYTYYLASLGMQVHAFEIDEKNFKSLQHGVEFNSREIADRVNLYPVGLGEKNARFGSHGANYEGFLKEVAGGSILGVSLDCFAHHMQKTLDLSNVSFVKLDVEGFEIAVLRGGRNSLFKKGLSNIGGMIMEVGPNRWNRADIELATGVAEMRDLSTLFKESYVLLRTTAHAATCPTTIGDGLKDNQPRDVIGGVKMFAVQVDEWEPLLSSMKKRGFDCNFFYKN